MPKREFTNFQVISKDEAEIVLSKEKLAQTHMRKRSKFSSKDGSTTHFIECTFTDCPKVFKLVVPSSSEDKATMLESDNAHDHSRGTFTCNGIGDDRKLVEEAIKMGIKKPKQIRGYLQSHGKVLTVKQVFIFIYCIVYIFLYY
jgi:hypothetical protein